jgi:hypothetical protein
MTAPQMICEADKYQSAKFIADAVIAASTARFRSAA